MSERMMTPEQFCYWLQGMIECKSEGDFFTLRETQAIRDHLSIVFTKVTPDRTGTILDKLDMKAPPARFDPHKRIC